MNKLLLIGPPGAGKTVMANKITQDLGLPFIKTGSLLRELPETDPDFATLQEAMLKGVLAPNEIVGRIVRKEVEKHPQGFILDGWLRQLIDFDVYDPNLDKVFFLDCPKEICESRVLNRVVCRIHGDLYSFSSEVCSLCKGKLEKRNDDTKETFEKRWQVYEEKTIPVIQLFEKMGKIIYVDASKSIPEVLEQIKRNL